MKTIYYIPVNHIYFSSKNSVAENRDFFSNKSIAIHISFLLAKLLWPAYNLKTVTTVRMWFYSWPMFFLYHCAPSACTQSTPCRGSLTINISLQHGRSRTHTRRHLFELRTGARQLRTVNRSFRLSARSALPAVRGYTQNSATGTGAPQQSFGKAIEFNFLELKPIILRACGPVLKLLGKTSQMFCLRAQIPVLLLS